MWSKVHNFFINVNKVGLVVYVLALGLDNEDNTHFFKHLLGSGNLKTDSNFTSICYITIIYFLEK